jgi:hypothetical protein
LQDQERLEIAKSIDNLRELKTMKQRISYASELNPEHLDKLRHYDPEFIDPIITGLKKRPARIEKAARLYYRITEGDMSPKRKPDYIALMEGVYLWYAEHPKEFQDLSKSNNGSLHEVLASLAHTLIRADSGEISELAGLQNALVCTHDFITTFQEAGIEPPKVVTKIHRRLENRRAHLDPGHTKDRHR